MGPFIPPSQHELTPEQRGQIHSASLITIVLMLALMVAVLSVVRFCSTHEIVQKNFYG